MIRALIRGSSSFFHQKPESAAHFWTLEKSTKISPQSAELGSVTHSITIPFSRHAIAQDNSPGRLHRTPIKPLIRPVSGTENKAGKRPSFWGAPEGNAEYHNRWPFAPSNRYPNHLKALMPMITLARLSLPIVAQAG